MLDVPPVLGVPLVLDVGVRPADVAVADVFTVVHGEPFAVVGAAPVRLVAEELSAAEEPSPVPCGVPVRPPSGAPREPVPSTLAGAPPVSTLELT